MKQNVGNTDRIVRAVLGLALVLIGLLVKMSSPVLPIILVLLGVILLATAAIRFCPLYLPFHISTKR